MSNDMNKRSYEEGKQIRYRNSNRQIGQLSKPSSPRYPSLRSSDKVPRRDEYVAEGSIEDSIWEDEYTTDYSVPIRRASLFQPTEQDDLFFEEEGDEQEYYRSEQRRPVRKTRSTQPLYLASERGGRYFRMHRHQQPDASKLHAALVLIIMLLLITVIESIILAYTYPIGTCLTSAITLGASVVTIIVSVTTFLEYFEKKRTKY